MLPDVSWSSTCFKHEITGVTRVTGMTMHWSGLKKGICPKEPIPLKNRFFLIKISLQQPLECAAVSGLFLSHLMNGVMGFALVGL
jgi:hypothetical protein